MNRVLLLVVVLASAANAQQMPNGTVDVYFQQLSRGGVPEGCSLVFTALTADTAYLKGAQVTMNGTIAIRSLDGKRLMFTGKLGTRTFEQQDSKWLEPHHFYFSSNTGTTAGKSKIAASETVGYKLLIADAREPSIARLMSDISKTGEFIVGFNRREKGQDVYTKVELSKSLTQHANGTAQITTNPNTEKEFDTCVLRLLGDIQTMPRAAPSK